MSQRFIYLFFVVFLCLPTLLVGQNLQLNAIGNSDSETKVIDSLGYKNVFKDYISLSNEIDSLQQRLIGTGYIDSRLISTMKKNDSIFEAKFQLNAL